jgi:hypothetical protein
VIQTGTHKNGILYHEVGYFVESAENLLPQTPGVELLETRTHSQPSFYESSKRLHSNRPTELQYYHETVAVIEVSWRRLISIEKHHNHTWAGIL